MRLAELSARSGVPTATIKYYLREGLLPPGRRITATQAEYDEDHLRRLRLVRAMIQVGRIPVHSAREVLAALQDDSLDRNERLGTAVWALPHGPEPDESDPATQAARRTADALLDRLGWGHARPSGTAAPPAYGMLVTAITALARLGYPCAVEDLEPYAHTVERIAAADLDVVERYATPEEQVEAAVALTVLYEPVLLSLRRLAEAEESHRRFGGA
ncbi:MerR family transcriptional regulator [Streptomyces mexicanus]|jgi:DNA-binding transcriptional MerR regulator|uniref:MerR family transcriptional regulator n=1 Tax=Streptomyces mexicanus TaxID=178566 RepID=A0A7X1I3F7_9ACTN|nr:MerR family transcriptional regulator [Streptomyces mexicanus]MBC2867560.1 MerR family transcriptional regulator [Streptomyces mexicanus]